MATPAIPRLTILPFSALNKMSQQTVLQIYPSSKTFVEAISPFVVGTTLEWTVKLFLGYAFEYVAFNTNDHGINYYATTTTSEGALQLLLSRGANGQLTIVPATADLVDLVNVDGQLELLVDWLTREEENFTKNYSTVLGRQDLSLKLVNLVAEKLGWPAPKLPRKNATLRAAVVGHSTFVPHPMKSPDDVVRVLALSDDLNRLTELYGQLLKDTGDYEIWPARNALEEVTSYVAGGMFWGYFASSDSGPPQLVAAATTRLSMPNVAGISCVVTDRDFRKRGYGAAITSALVTRAFKSEDEGGLGKRQVTLFYDELQGTEKMYKRIGFEDGERCNLWLFQKP